MVVLNSTISIHVNNFVSILVLQKFGCFYICPYLCFQSVAWSSINKVFCEDST